MPTMRKNHTSNVTPLKQDRYHLLSLNYNIRFDGQYDDGGGKLLLALLPHTAPALPKERRGIRSGKTSP